MTQNLTDIHIHLLPGLDDGPADTATAINLAQTAAAAGTRIAVCTPHLKVGYQDNTRSVVLNKTAVLKENLAAARLDLDVLPGAEVMAHPDLLALLDQDELPTLGDHGRHLLLEMPWQSWPPGLDELIFQLQQRGLEIIVAHPERYRQVRQKPQLVEQWVSRGLLMQLNAESLTAAGSTTSRLARHMLEQGWVHFIASDGHSPARPPHLQPVLTWLADRYGEKAREQALANALAVARGTADKIAPLPAEQKSTLWSWPGSKLWSKWLK